MPEERDPLLVGWLGCAVHGPQHGKWYCKVRKHSVKKWRVACAFTIAGWPLCLSVQLKGIRLETSLLLFSFLLLSSVGWQGAMLHTQPCSSSWGSGTLACLAAWGDSCNSDTWENQYIYLYSSPSVFNATDLLFFFSSWCSQLSSFHRLSRQYSTDALLIIKNVVRYVKCQSGCFLCLCDAGLNLRLGMWFQLALSVIRK